MSANGHAVNFLQTGEAITILAPAATELGDVVYAGGILGVALNTAVQGHPLDLHLTGVWEFPKVAANAFEIGDPVYWDIATKIAGSFPNTQVGIAVEAALSGSATVKVLLNWY